MQASLLDLIKRTRPRRALFTTFTFSPMWFDMFPLQALRKTGCNHIEVLVDARQAGASTQEANSQSAGMAYRVIEVPMPGSGVFHPKLAYFETTESDVLVVGSGNLTLAGQARNLEVIDAVTDNTDPELFGEFAEFLRLLGTRFPFAPENESVLQYYADRARSRSRSKPRSRDSWLVHSLEHNVRDQFIEIVAREITHPSSLTVLAPFHAADGGPLERLAQATRVKSVQIGLGTETSTEKPVAPFDESRLVLTVPYRFVQPSIAGKKNRPLHAKCFDLAGRHHHIVMTGSVNATRQSLETTTNVEVSLVRKRVVADFEWIAAEPACFEPCEFSAEQDVFQVCSVQATWTADNHIRGLIRPAPNASTALLEIQRGPDVVMSVEEIPILDGGAFTANVHGLEPEGGALRITLSAETWRAYGWLNVEMSLQAVEGERNLLRDANKILMGQDDGASVRQLLTLLDKMVSPPSVSASSRKKNSQPKTSGYEKLTYEAWLEWQKSLNPFRHSGVNASIGRFAYTALLHYLSKSPQENTTPEPADRKGTGAGLPQPRRQPRVHEIDDDFEKMQTESAKEKQRRREEKEAAARVKNETRRRKIIQAIRPRVQRAPNDEHVVLMVRASAQDALTRALYNHRMYGFSNQTSSESLRVLHQWLGAFSTFDYDARNRALLLPLFSLLACCAAALLPTDGLNELRSHLEALSSEPLVAADVQSYAEQALKQREFNIIPQPIRSEIASHAMSIFAAPSVEDEVVPWIDKALTAESRPEFPEPYASALNALYDNRNTTDKPIIGLVSRNSTSCPLCNLTGEILKDSIQTKPAFVCVGRDCKKPLFVGLTRQALERRGLADRARGVI